MLQWQDLDKTKSYKRLSKLKQIPRISKLLSPERIEKFETSIIPGLYYNFSAKNVDNKILAQLQNIADEQQLTEKYQALLNGEIINTSEKRMVLHHLLREQQGNEVIFEGKNLRKFYLEQQEDIKKFAEAVHLGKITGSTGKKFTNVVQIGIGGSYLGPQAVYLALKRWAITNQKNFMDAFFIANVDPDDSGLILSKINLDETLFILVSKSGTTQETLANENIVRKTLIKNNLNPNKHIIAITSQSSKLASSTRYLKSFFMDDFIGGRYSVSSPAGGALISLAFGAEVFEEFLAGAAKADSQALEKNILKNAPLLDALIGIYERNILKYSATAILPYSQALEKFPAHLQQLDMESNGKSANRFGKNLKYKTGPLVFGEAGTNGQHSFYQLLHQGSDIIPLQFIGFKDSQLSPNQKDSQTKLKANLIAQIVAFACGQASKNLNENFPGEKPSSLIYGAELTPTNLGSLISHYENKIMFQGFVWNINSFDQAGVQLGKTLAQNVLSGEDNKILQTFYTKLSRL